MYNVNKRHIIKGLQHKMLRKRNMTKKKSFIHHIFIYLLISISSLLCVLGAFLFSSYNILENEISDSFV